MHKGSVSAVKTSNGSAGFSIAATETGVIEGLREIITAETMSQRYVFLTEMAEAEQELQGTVYEDHLSYHEVRKHTHTHMREACAMSIRLSSPEFHYIIHRPHSRGHVDPDCKKWCLPDVDKNALFLRHFTTRICESVNSDLLLSGHTVQHMQQWSAFFVVSEFVEVHNELKAQRRREAGERQQRKRARVREGHAVLCAPCKTCSQLHLVLSNSFQIV